MGEGLRAPQGTEHGGYAALPQTDAQSWETANIWKNGRLFLCERVLLQMEGASGLQKLRMLSTIP